MPTGGTCYRSTRNRPGGEPNRPRVLLAQSPVAAYLSGPPAQTPGAIPDADGAVAQLGERVNGIHEVRGSIPLGSTNKNIDLFQGIGRLMQSRPHCGERSLYHRRSAGALWSQEVSAGAACGSFPLRNISGTLAPSRC